MKPTGIVTFLFTDIEGSTKLSQEYPEKLHAALERHNEILRKVVESNNGFVFEIVGDAFCCAFEKASDAVKAAVEAQIKLLDQKWDDVVIRIRIGIHSGNAEWNGKRYMGYITLARTARVISAAYGEQIIISNDVYELTKDKFGSYQEDTKAQSESESDSDTSCLSDLVVKNISFRDLGERRLKDLNQPVRLFQILSDGLREEFPPIKTLDARPNNLPVQLTNFIGREKELKHAKELFNDTHLLTLTGSGGAGKTRFSLQAGADLIDDFANGVWFIELAAISDPVFLPVTINNALGIKEEPMKTPEETLTDYLKDKEILLILDNCEHLINACADLTERLLTSCPKLNIIATSREALNCDGEQTYRIPPLTQPNPDQKDTPEQLTQYESVRLFVERAIAVNPKFRVDNENAAALAEVCSRLDGIPLAIELAAARIKVLSVEKIYERLDDRFNLLTGGKRTALPRQQTLRALIDWSYDLLSDNEKILWSRLSVFSGGWTLEAAEEVCTYDSISKNEILDLLSQLTEKSIIIYDGTKDRYKILENIKQYGSEKLQDDTVIFLQHLNYYLEFSEKAKPELQGESLKIWIDKIEADHRNFLSAIEWSINNDRLENGAVIADAVGKYWDISGFYSIGIRLFEIILKNPGTLSKSLNAKILSLAGYFKNINGDYEQGKKYLEKSLSLRKEIGDKKEIAGSLNNIGVIILEQGDFNQSKKYLEESLDIRKEIDDKTGIAFTLNNLGLFYINQGDYEHAKEYYEESLRIFQEIGDKNKISLTLSNLGILSYNQDNLEQAMKYQEESMEISKEIGDKNRIAYSLANLGNVSLIQRDFEHAKKHHEESLRIRMEIGAKPVIAEGINNLGNVAFILRDYELAEKHYKESLDIRKEIGSKPGIADSLNSLGNAAYGIGNFEKAIKLLCVAEVTFKSLGASLEKIEQKIKDKTIAELREQLSDDEFIKYWEEGKMMTLEEAVQLTVNS